MLPFSSVGYNAPPSRAVPAPIYRHALPRRTPPTGPGWRNAYIYTSGVENTLIGGLWVAKGLTNASLYSMVVILCTFSDTFSLRYPSGQLVKRDQNPLQQGDYFIFTNGSIKVNSEIPLLRTQPASSQPAIRSPSFHDAVRERDRRCVLSDRPARMAKYGDWSTFEATHIFPLEYVGQWNNLPLANHIAITPTTKSDGSINSPQNGILLGLDEHQLFTSYQVSIDPDDNYKIVCFTPDTLDFKLPGRHLDQRFVKNPLRPVDEVLRWHFKQAVLVHVRGVGESPVGMNFPQPSCFDADD